MRNRPIMRRKEGVILPEQLQLFDNRVAEIKRFVAFEKSRRILWAFLERHHEAGYHSGYLACLGEIEDLLKE